MKLFTWGFAAGFLIMFFISHYLEYLYKKILLMKSKDHSAECLHGEFVMIVTEKEYGEISRAYWENKHGTAKIEAGNTNLN